MEPLSALSIAAAVVQFADFGFRLAKNAHELYKASSGQKAAHLELLVVSQDLSRLADDVQDRMSGKQAVAGEVFLQLVGECASLHTELQGILAKLRAHGSTKTTLAASSWMTALKEVAAAGDMEKLASRLSQVRQQMNVALLYLLLLVPLPSARSPERRD
jgi:hypothetical protein